VVVGLVFVTGVRVADARHADATSAMPWPVLLRPAVSSSFCEYREGHLHAGLDVRTFGREGAPCIACGDGYVSRLRASARSYGKALYVQLDSGKTLVYAHLAEFLPRLEVRLAEQQRRVGRYRVDMRLGADDFRVHRGDVIAWSGHTGANAPHLHFEIRTADEYPLNPLSHGLALRDSMWPAFDGVRFVPLASRARISGACFPRRMPVRRTGTGQWELADTVALRGPVGIEVNAYDRINRESGRLAPRSLALDVDGTRVASILLDRFRFADASEVGFVYAMASVRASRRAYYYPLFHQTGETLWNRRFVDGGRLNAHGAADLHRAAIVVSDAAGNTSRLQFVFRGDDDSSETARPWPDTPEANGIYGRNGLLCAQTTPRGVDASAWQGIAGAVSGGNNTIVLTAAALGPAPISLPVGRGGDAPRLYAVGLRPEQARSIRFAPLDVELIVGARCFYGEQVLWMRRPPPGMQPAGKGPELVVRGKPVLFGPASLVLKADVELRFTSGPYDSTDAIYRQGGDGWDFYASVRDHDVISTMCRRPGLYAVFSDRFAPAIRRPVLHMRKPYSGGTAVRELVVPVEDAGSGVDDERTIIEVAGQRQIARWDFVSKKFFVTVREPNIIGDQDVRVVAFDQAGNHSEIDTTINFATLQ